MKNNKGITLIALIITIIVMLILVAVTVALTLEGKIFSRSKDVTKDTEMHMIYEIITSAAQFENGYIKVKDTAEGAKALLEDDDKPTTINPNPLTDETNEAILTVKGQTGTFYYKITKKEIIIWHEEEILPWWKFRDGEIDEIKNAGEADEMIAEGEMYEEMLAYGLNYPEGSVLGIYSVAEGGLVELLDTDTIIIMPGNSQYLVFLSGNPIMDIAYGFTFDSNLPKEQWLLFNNSREYVGPYNGVCPIFYNNVFIDSDYIYCEDYFDRVRDSFTKKWYEMTEEEIQGILDVQYWYDWSVGSFYSGLRIAEDKANYRKEVWYRCFGGAIIIDEMVGDDSSNVYIYVTDEKYFEDAEFDYQEGLQLETWYKAEVIGDNSGDSDWRVARSEIPLVEYTGPCPFDKTVDFTGADDIYCETFLDRVAASFESNS